MCVLVRAPVHARVFGMAVWFCVCANVHVHTFRLRVRARSWASQEDRAARAQVLREPACDGPEGESPHTAAHSLPPPPVRMGGAIRLSAVRLVNAQQPLVPFPIGTGEYCGVPLCTVLRLTEWQVVELVLIMLGDIGVDKVEWKAMQASLPSAIPLPLPQPHPLDMRPCFVDY